MASASCRLRRAAPLRPSLSLPHPTTPHLRIPECPDATALHHLGERDAEQGEARGEGRLDRLRERETRGTGGIVALDENALAAVLVAERVVLRERGGEVEEMARDERGL